MNHVTVKALSNGHVLIEIKTGEIAQAQAVLSHNAALELSKALREASPNESPPNRTDRGAAR